MSALWTLAGLVVIALGYLVANDTIRASQGMPPYPLLAALPFGCLLLLVRRNSSGNAMLLFVAFFCAVTGLKMISDVDSREGQEWAPLIVCCIQLVIAGAGSAIVLLVRTSSARRG
jgi:hypothetical protein